MTDNQPPKRIWLNLASREAQFYGDHIFTGAFEYLAADSDEDAAPNSVSYIRADLIPVERIREYFVVGGWFNPEMMEHDKVRELRAYRSC